MSSREQILNRLERKNKPFRDVSPSRSYHPMVPLGDRSPLTLLTRFQEEAQKVGCTIYTEGTHESAIETILELLGADRVISSWELSTIPIQGLGAALNEANIICESQDSNVRVGLTGVNAALAATGSLVVYSGQGRFRATSLLPPVHIAIVAASQILPDLESWWEVQKEFGLDHIRQSSNIVIITGPCRTADIAMELVMGMHGPRQLNLILLANA